MEIEEPNPVADRITIAGWSACGLLFLFVIYLIIFVGPPPPPDPHTFRQVAAIVNTSNIVNVYTEGDFTRVQYRGKASNNDLFVEPPSHFLGPCRVIHATRLDQ